MMTTAYELDLDIKQEPELTTPLIDELDLDIKQEPELTTPIIDEVDLVNICTVEQLNNVSEDFLSGDDKKPLLSRDVAGNEYKHYLRPMVNSAMFILLVEGLERFAFYGVAYTEQNFLEGGES